MISNIESFLRRRENSDAIVGLLDRFDRKITALALYSGSSPAAGLPLVELVQLAADDNAGEASALQHVRSLKERLILYSYKDAEGLELVGVSPPLLSRLASELSPSEALSISAATDEPEAPDPFAAFCALVSATAHAKPAFKGRREPSKRMAQILDASIPGLSGNAERLASMLGALEASGIMGAGEDGRPAVYPRRFVELCDSAGSAASLALAAGCIVKALGNGRLAPGLLHAVVAALPRGIAVSAADARRIVAMAARRYLEPLAVSGSSDASEALGRGLVGMASGIVDALVMLGLVAVGDDGLIRTTTAAAGVFSLNAPVPKSIVVEESHEIRILPEASRAARAFVVSVARMENAGLVWSATLDKSAAKAAYAFGFTASEVESRLEELSGIPLPQSVRFSLEAWESESMSARVRVGVVVVLDGHLSGVIEHSPKAIGLVAERLTDGVYMLAARDAPDAERLLKAAGIDVDMRPSPTDDDTAVRALWTQANAALANDGNGLPLAFLPASATLVPEESPLVVRLLAALDGMNPSPDERADLEDRIKARLVLDESQLTTAKPTDDGSVAGAMDYPGKLRLMERAMKDGAAVEISWIDESGKQAKATGVPREIRRTPTGTVVALSTGGGEQIVVAVSAIGKVHRLRNMMFGA
ncbi:MAG: hypothetical protein CVV51_08340 [Spirochaetae bacterium HGW-Spirochaetae-7]|nr:MAG: hypothetical protein CVV51_08340 [Spirochaetae bacterium HGW-Spirochaetae-7]